MPLENPSESIFKGRGFRLACHSEEISLVEELLQGEGYEFHRVPIDRFARVATRGRKSLGTSLSAFFGLIYIQDITSMLPPLALDPGQGEVVLDMCASPGGKSGVLSRLVGQQGAVLANEPVPKRLGTLRINLQHTGCLNTATTCYSGESFPEAGPFRRILLDVPCSGWGTAEKNPHIMKIWDRDRTEPLVTLQRRLLARAWQLLEPGGRMIYSTCTTNSKENEEQMEWAARELGAEMETLREVEGFSVHPCSGAASGAMRIHGGRYGGQSFFLAALKKPVSSQEKARPGPEADCAEYKAEEADLGLLAEEGLHLEGLPSGKLQEHQGELFFLPTLLEEFVPGQMRCKGIHLGKRDKKGLRLAARLRCLLPPPEEFPSVNAYDVEELRRLRSGQSLSFPATGRRMGLYWRGMPLGFLAVKQGRCLWAEKT